MNSIDLISASPRRKQLLENYFKVNVTISTAEETSSYFRPHLAAMDIAKSKMAGIDTNGKLCISADTIVWIHNKRLGKPKNHAQAKEMLQLLSGKTHSVYTGVCLKKDGKEILFYDKSRVTFKDLCEETIESYIKTGSPFDKAGGYGIQDEALVKNYQGSYSNIMGLPMEKLLCILDKEGLC